MPRVTITVPDKNAQPYRFQLDRQSVYLGRGSDNDIAIDSGSVSVKHAEMRRVEGGYELRDLGSTNGIKLDGERCEVIPLRSGISVKLGDVAFDFQLSDEERAALAREKPDNESPIEHETEETLPKAPSSKPPRQSEDQEETAAGGGGFWMILLFLILAVAAFGAGMAVRFQKETGGSLLDAIKSKSRTVKVPAPAGPATPAATPDAAAPE